MNTNFEMGNFLKLLSSISTTLSLEFIAVFMVWEIFSCQFWKRLEEGDMLLHEDWIERNNYCGIFGFFALVSKSYNTIAIEYMIF